MRRQILFAAALAAGLTGLSVQPARAQASKKVLTIFGNDPCPTSNGEEIVVCNHLPENERYRIPKDLRDPENPANLTWGEKAKSLDGVGAAGISTCSAVGANGQSGCFNQVVRQARQESRDKGQEPSIPLKLP